MIPASEHSYLVFRNQLLLRFLLLALVTGFIVKFGNILLAYPVFANAGYIDDVAGFSLAKYAPNFSWAEAIAFGSIASLSVIGAIMGLLVVDRFKVRVVRLWADKDLRPKREFATLLLLFASTLLISSAGVLAAETLAMLTFLPLVVYSLLNPAWGKKHAKTRIALALFLASSGFALSTSKTIVLHLFIAGALYFLHTHRRWKTVILLSCSLAILYPYLNVFRSVSATSDVNMALSITATIFEEEFSEFGLFKSLMNAYSAILDRIVGLDGLFVATIFQGQEGLTSREISFQLAGYKGIGISLGMFGKLYVKFQDLFFVAFLYPVVVLAFWRMIRIISVFMDVHGFPSFTTFLYVKAIFIIIGGFRWTDIKLIIAAILAVLFVGWLLKIGSSSMGTRKRGSLENKIST